MSPELQRCRDEQLRCATALLTETNPLDRAGLRMGAADWLMEEVLITRLEAETQGAKPQRETCNSI